MTSAKSISEYIRSLRSETVSARQLVEDALDRIDAPDGEGSRAFMGVWHERARDFADYVDRYQLWRDDRLPLCGIPISVKDLFDVAGEITRAGSKARDDQSPATADALAVWRLRAAGANLIGRTTMSEFAFSGIGTNRHFGTPRNPWDRATGRIPGGSSSGAAVAVADGMGIAALGSDTGGSIRAPAALCGIVGFKPTASPALLEGAFPRSYSLDTVGPLAMSVSSCATIAAVLFGDRSMDVADPASLRPLEYLRIGILQGDSIEDLSPEVEATFSRAMTLLSRKGARICEFTLPDLERIRDVNGRIGVSPAEAFSIHRSLAADHPEMIEQTSLARIENGGTIKAADYIDVLRARHTLMEEVGQQIRSFDAVIMPTCPIVAPPISSVQDNEAFNRMSGLVLRNCNLANFLDLPAISLPIHEPGTAPVGLTLMGQHGRDDDLLRTSLAVEAALRF